MSASDPKLVEPVAWLRSHPSGLKVAATSPATQSWQLEGGWTEMPLFPASALEAAEARIAALTVGKDEAQALADRLSRDAPESFTEVGELLAVIHRDGGHYEAEHGYLKAMKDAETVVLDNRARNAALEAENGALREKVRKLQKPEFFWDYNNPECCYDSWSDALDEPNLGDVVHLLTGISLPDVWVTTRVLTVDDDGDPDETEPALFHNKAEADACFPTSLEDARAALRQAEEKSDG